MALKPHSSALRLSVVLMADRQRARAERAIHSLLRQSVIEGMEVLVLDFGAGEQLCDA